MIDLVPASIRQEGGVAELRNARIVSTSEGRVRVFVVGANGQGVQLAREYQAEAIEPSGYRQYRIRTDDGEVFEVKRAGHCACGSPLKSFNPRRWTP